MAFLKRYALLIIVIFVIAGGVAWYGLYGKSGEEPILSTDTSSLTDPGQALVQTLLAVRGITLSGSIFTDPAFTGLKDFSTQIVSEPVGRPNPFAPVIVQNAPPPAPNEAKLFAPKPKK